MKKCCLLLIASLISCFCFAQQPDSTTKPLSQWILRFNPISFFQPVGGIQLGIETNLDSRSKYSLVSEYGYIFLNSFKMYSAEENEDNKNNGHISGFEIKQEVRMRLNSKKNPGTSFLSVEVNYQKAKLNNAGWFGMGKPDAFGLYPYFKYQDFQETSNETSIAMKYVLKSFPDNRKFNLEGFIGFGFIYKDIVYKKAEGKLVQPDKEPIFNVYNKGVNPYFPLGLRLLFKLR